MGATLLPSLAETVTVRPLVSMRTVDVHDPRGVYAETFWLPTVGPTALWIARRFSLWLLQDPAGATVDLGHVAEQVGCPGAGRSSVTRKALERLAYFDLLRDGGASSLLFRPLWPSLLARQVSHLPEHLRNQHTRLEARSA